MTVRRNTHDTIQVIEQEGSPARKTYQTPGNEPSSADLRTIIESSVRDHMIADVPVAIALSGGLDSSIVAAAASMHHPGLQAYTFTLSSSPDPEVEHAALLCKHLGLKHHVARMVNSNVDGWLRRVAWHLEEPVANVNALLGFGLAALMHADGFKVALVGEGADEVFGGYPWYGFALEPSMQNQPHAVFDAYRKRRAQSRSGQFLRPAALALATERMLVQREAFTQRLNEFKHAPLDGFLSFDQETQLQYSQLLRVDRMFMSQGVEARVPFLYRPVLAASASLPANRKFSSPSTSGRMEKIALAEAFSEILPKQITFRPKFGEQGTVNIWSTWLATALEQEFERCIEGIELKGARQLLDEFINWQAVRSLALSSKEKFTLALLLESVDTLLFSRTPPDTSMPVKWEML
jgi:asparagine synthase (glutamine-hydrolysing)